MKIAEHTVTLRFLNELCGGIPLVDAQDSPEERAERYEPWVAKQADLNGGTETDAAAVAVLLAEDETMPEGDEIPLKGFRRSLGRPVVETRQIKAMLKEATQRLGYWRNAGDARMKQHLQHDVAVRSTEGDDLVDLGVEDITGIIERPIHVMTPQGPRTSISAGEYVEGAEITFVVKVLEDGVAQNTLTRERLVEALTFAGEFTGFGADRSQGYGRFAVEEVS